MLVAVSGGGDSVALLHLLARWAPRRELTLVVAHLDHGLRPRSSTDRRFVETLARRLGLDYRAERREVERLRRRDESPEEAARRVRREFLAAAREATQSTHVALGHTLDDQAETVLMRLARGTGSTGLAAMALRGPGPLVRPLLGIERAELRGFLARHALAHREDRSNGDLRFDRNRVRRLVVPVLSSALNPRAARNLVRAAEHLRTDAEFLDGWAEARFAAMAQLTPDHTVRLIADELAAEPAVIAQRVALLALRRAGGDARRIGSRHVRALIDLVATAEGRSIDLPSGLQARRVGAWVQLGRRHPTDATRS